MMSSLEYYPFRMFSDTCFLSSKKLSRTNPDQAKEVWGGLSGQMPGGHGAEESADYRYGYQGSEKDDEIKGSGNSYTTYYRMLDPRVGRWFSTDPVIHSYESPYVSMGNNPIINTDVRGNTIEPVNEESKSEVDNSIKGTFTSDALISLFLNSYNEESGKFENISQQKFLEATKGLSEDEKALAHGLYQKINSSQNLQILAVHDDKKVVDEEGFQRIQEDLRSEKFIPGYVTGEGILRKGNKSADGSYKYHAGGVSLKGENDNSVLFVNFARLNERKVVVDDGSLFGSVSTSDPSTALMSRIIGDLWYTEDAFIINGGSYFNPNKAALSKTEVKEIDRLLAYTQLENMGRRINDMEELYNNSPNSGQNLIPEVLEIWVELHYTHGIFIQKH